MCEWLTDWNRIKNNPIQHRTIYNYTKEVLLMLFWKIWGKQKNCLWVTKGVTDDKHITAHYERNSVVGLQFDPTQLVKFQRNFTLILPQKYFLITLYTKDLYSETTNLCSRTAPWDLCLTLVNGSAPGLTRLSVRAAWYVISGEQGTYHLTLP